MEIPRDFVIEAYRLLGFALVPDPAYNNLVFDDGQGMMFFHQQPANGMLDLYFVLLDIESTEGPNGMEPGWTHETWLPRLADVLRGTEYELSDDDTPND